MKEKLIGNEKNILFYNDEGNIKVEVCYKYLFWGFW